MSSFVQQGIKTIEEPPELLVLTSNSVFRFKRDPARKGFLNLLPQPPQIVRVNPALPQGSCLDGFQGQTGKFESGLVHIKGVPVWRQDRNELRNGINDLTQFPLIPANLLLRLLAAVTSDTAPTNSSSPDPSRTAWALT